MQTSTLSQAIRIALLAGATCSMSMLAAGSAAAQDTSGEDAAAVLDRIEVTGSRIRQIDLETAQPILTITRMDIENQGFQSVADILQNISAAGSPVLSRAEPLASGPNIGGQFISLRNLGSTRTLVLVNGERIGISVSGLQDISLIPIAAVDRIEVLKDSASSLYGSDAIGGVINIITRSGYDGGQASVYWGQYSQGDGAIERADGVLGVRGDRGSLTFAVEYANEDEVMSANRDFSAYPQSYRHPTRGWTIVGKHGAVNAAGGWRVLDPDADWRDIANYSPQDTDVGGASQASGGAGTTRHKSNTNEQTHLRTPLERRAIFVDGVFDVNERVRLSGNVLYSDRDSALQVAGYPLQSAAFPNLPMMSVDSYYNPVGSHHGYDNPQAVNYRRRTWELPRRDDVSSSTFRLSGRLDGSFEVGDRYFAWDAGYLYNNNKVLQTNTGNLNLTNVAQATGASFLNANGVVQCGTPDNPIPLGTGQGECIPWNPFIPYGRTGDGGLTDNADLMNFLFAELHATSDASTKVGSLNLAGDLFELPAGTVGFAVGAERRTESAEFVPDAMAVAGASSFLASRPTRGSYTEDSAYAEFQVPLLSGVTGAQELSLNLSSRYSDFNTFGDTTTSKVGLQWRPVDEVLVRGTWAEGFRAPTISNLFGGGSQTFPFLTDPCDTSFGAAATNADVLARCAQHIADAASYRQLAQGFVPASGINAQTPVALTSGSNPDLTPEESVSKNLGMVWSPRFVDGLTMSLDWWHINIDNTIVTDTATQILNDCYIQNDPARCALFTRDQDQGYVDGMIISSINAGYRKMEGFDFDLAYRLSTDIGNFTLAWQNTYTSHDEIKTDTNPDTPPSQLVGFAGNITSFRLRSTLNLGWQMGNVGVNWGVRHFSSLRESCLNATLFPEECTNPDYVAANPGQTRAINRTGSNTFHDVQGRWETPWDATVSIGANNVFNRLGPPMYTQPSANVSYYGGWDIGRFYYMRYEQRF